MNLDYLYEKARRRASPALDFDDLAARYRTRNAEIVAEWRTRFPGTDAAVLEITIVASGQSRRRLRRYRELAGFGGGVPGILRRRELASFDEILDFRLIEVGAAASRAEVHQIEWRLLSVAEALPPTP